MKPFVKWVGGKTQLLPILKNFVPKQFNNYFEPFVGGGALLFEIKPSNAYINDLNSELICVYKCFTNEYDYFLMINELMRHDILHCESYYYFIRDMDKDENFLNLPLYVRSARMIYLNKSCFNGLYRVNSKGFFNVPFCHSDKIFLFDINNFNSIKEYFSSSNIFIFNCDFENVVKFASKGDFVYFDPPYDSYDNKSCFNSYVKNSFSTSDQVRLSKVFRELSDRGVLVMLSNHNTALINYLYKDFNIHVISARRFISSKSLSRGFVDEVIITNY